MCKRSFKGQRSLYRGDDIRIQGHGTGNPKPVTKIKLAQSIKKESDLLKETMKIKLRELRLRARLIIYPGTLGLFLAGRFLRTGISDDQQYGGNDKAFGQATHNLE